MKKIITLCFFAFALVLGTQTMNGQSKDDINNLALAKTQELKKSIKFNSETENEVYHAYLTYEKKMYSVNEHIANGKTVTEEDKAKVEALLTDRLKQIFTEEQYEQYLTLKQNN